MFITTIVLLFALLLSLLLLLVFIITITSINMVTISLHVLYFLLLLLLLYIYIHGWFHSATVDLRHRNHGPSPSGYTVKIAVVGLSRSPPEEDSTGKTYVDIYHSDLFHKIYHSDFLSFTDGTPIKNNNDTLPHFMCMAFWDASDSIHSIHSPAKHWQT